MNPQKPANVAHGLASAKVVMPAVVGGAVNVGTVAVPAGILSHPISDARTISDDFSFTAAEVLHGLTYITNDQQASKNGTLPSAADIISAFAVALKPLKVGDMFNYIIVMATGSNTISVYAASDMTYADGRSYCSVLNKDVLVLTMEVASLATPAIVLHPLQSVGS
jgi:hypothetical protein